MKLNERIAGHCRDDTVRYSQVDRSVCSKDEIVKIDKDLPRKKRERVEERQVYEAKTYFCGQPSAAPKTNHEHLRIRLFDSHSPKYWFLRLETPQKLEIGLCTALLLATCSGWRPSIDLQFQCPSIWAGKAQVVQLPVYRSCSAQSSQLSALEA
jgi:hypothetical protein